MLSTSKIGLISDNMVVQADLDTSILSMEMKHEPESPIVESPQYKLNPEMVLKETYCQDLLLDQKVRFYRHDENKMFRNRMVTFKLKVFKGENKEVFDIFEG